MSVERAWKSALFAVAIVVFLPPAASRAAYFQNARFRATLSARQSSSWTLNHSDACGSQTGGGGQLLVFKQAGKLTLTFRRQLGGTRLLDVRAPGPRATEIPIKGELTRTGTVAYSPNGRCTSAPDQHEGEATAPPPSECGTHRFSGFIRPSWATPSFYPTLPGEPKPKVPQLWFDEPQTVSIYRCPWYGPGLIFRISHAGLPEGRIFGRAKSLTVRDAVSQVDRYPAVPAGVLSETSVRWTLHLARLP